MTKKKPARGGEFREGGMGRPRVYDECICGGRKQIKRDFCEGCYGRLPSIYRVELMTGPGKARDEALRRARRFLYGGAST
jgi:hypothetical protein